MYYDYKVGDEVIYTCVGNPMYGLVAKITKLFDKAVALRFNIINRKGKLRFASNVQYKIVGREELVLNSKICRLLYC